MRIVSPALASLRRHAWLVVVLVALVLAWFVAIGWFARTLGDDIARSVQPVPAVDDSRHRAE